MQLSPLPPVLFEDEWLIAFDKPGGLPTTPDSLHPSAGNLMQTVWERLSPDIFNVHRLDAETSGVLLCAKTRDGRQGLCRLIEARKARTEYLAITRGSPQKDSGSIDLRLARDERWPGRMRVAVQGGKPSQTDYAVVERWREYGLVKAIPLTGLPHQVRVHLAAIDAPVLGDAFYGKGRGLYLSDLKRTYKAKPNHPERPLIGHIALHASSFTFTHPATGQPLTILAPMPKKFSVAIKYLRMFAAV